jgi:flagellar hook protein FlgE
MMRSMFAAISGLKVHQTMLDVTANDIANVNTLGYKGERATFEDALSQLQRGASAPSTTSGGTNPTQIGLGVRLGGVNNIMSDGAIQSTGNPLDCAIQGEGFFRVAPGNSTTATVGAGRSYTRAGNFALDQNGALVTPDGSFVVGYAWNAATSSFGTTDAMIKLPTGAKNVSIGQNGVVTYVDPATNSTVNLAQITLAKFNNAAGLQRVSGNKFQTSTNSGPETVDTPGGPGGTGVIASSSIEMSNVDLAQEFTSMITAQRGFQANSRVISTADDMLQELVNLKR